MRTDSIKLDQLFYNSSLDDKAIGYQYYLFAESSSSLVTGFNDLI